MKNKQVDLADSEHIDITKSTFNKFYGTGQNQTLGSGNQGTSNEVNKNSSAFSFSGQRNTNQVSSQNVNRNSDPAVNRISGGSIYDYDQNRADY